MDRSLLGPADVDDDALAAMVADLLGHEAVDLLDVAVEHVPYDVPSLTTVGRYWVTGRAATPAGPRPFRLFVKHVQAWHHSPFFADVPEEAREMARASYPWRTEPLAYASDLGDRLPDGLTMPRAVGVVEFEPDCRRDLDGAGRPPAGGVGRRALPPRGVPAGPDGREPRRGRARRCRRVRLVGDAVRARPARLPDRPDARGRRPVAAPGARGRLRRHAPRPAARGGEPQARSTPSS